MNIDRWFGLEDAYNDECDTESKIDTLRDEMFHALRHVAKDLHAHQEAIDELRAKVEGLEAESHHHCRYCNAVLTGEQKCICVPDMGQNMKQSDPAPSCDTCAKNKTGNHMECDDRWCRPPECPGYTPKEPCGERVVTEQLAKLADFIMREVPGRPNGDDGGAGDCAINIIREQTRTITDLQAAVREAAELINYCLWESFDSDMDNKCKQFCKKYGGYV